MASTTGGGRGWSRGRPSGRCVTRLPAANREPLRADQIRRGPGRAVGLTHGMTTGARLGRARGSAGWSTARRVARLRRYQLVPVPDAFATARLRESEATTFSISLTCARGIAHSHRSRRSRRSRRVDRRDSRTCCRACARPSNEQDAISVVVRGSDGTSASSRRSHGGGPTAGDIVQWPDRVVSLWESWVCERVRTFGRSANALVEDTSGSARGRRGRAQAGPGAIS